MFYCTSTVDSVTNTILPQEAQVSAFVYGSACNVHTAVHSWAFSKLGAPLVPCCPDEVPLYYIQGVLAIAGGTDICD